MAKKPWFIRSLLQEFQVSNEEALYQKLVKESTKIRCSCCHKEYPIEQMSYPNGDPVCKNCR